jgi:uncharacterized membrane protein YcaP (DUF421 family)
MQIEAECSLSEYIELVLRSATGFVLLLFLSRVIGQKFAVISGTVIGTVLGLYLIIGSFSFWKLLTVSITWFILTMAYNLIRTKSVATAQFLTGKPQVIIEQGKILEKNLSKANISIPDMMSLLRSKNVFKVADVELGVMEPGGELNVMKKSGLNPLTPVVQGIQVEEEQSPHILIANGQVIAQNMIDLGISHGWLLGEIKKQGAHDYSDVFLAQVDSKGGLYVDIKKDAEQPPAMKQRSLLLTTFKKIEADLTSFALETKNQKAQAMYKEGAQKVNSLIEQLTPFLRE